jgi:hypothetical protein
MAASAVECAIVTNKAGNAEGNRSGGTAGTRASGADVALLLQCSIQRGSKLGRTCLNPEGACMAMSIAAQSPVNIVSADTGGSVQA